MGRAVFARMRAGSFLIARPVPVGDEWLLSGVSSVLPARDRAEAYRWAAELAARHPALVFRNPAKLARGWELQAGWRGAAAARQGKLLRAAGAAQRDPAWRGPRAGADGRGGRWRGAARGLPDGAAVAH